MSALTDLTAGEIAAQVGTRKVSARDVAKAFLDRIDKLNPAVNAVCTPNPAALADAEAANKRLASGEPARPLEGVPFFAKDNIDTKGLRTTFGSRLMEHNVPAEDSVCVERLRAAGAVLLGKTNTPEFAHDVNTSNFLFGTTRNPWNLMRTAGGSSGGSGAAVAARFAPLAIGTDLGGSVRIPASFNGLVGIRPAPGRVPFYPTDFGWDTLVPHLVGPLAANTRDAALMLAVMSGPDERDPASLPEQDLRLSEAASGRASLKGRRVAYWPDFGGIVPVDNEVRALVDNAAQAFADLGCEVEEAPFDCSEVAEIVGGTRSFGMVARYAERYDKHKDQMTSVLKNQIEAAFQADVRSITRAEKQRTHFWQRLVRFMNKYDYILGPSCGAPPFRLDVPLPDQINGKKVARFYDVFLTTYAFSITGLPTAAVPCGFTSAGLPVGIQIVAHRLREDRAVEAAAAYEAAHPEHFKRPEIDPSQAKSIPQVLPTPGMVMTR
jgi:amidase